MKEELLIPEISENQTLLYEDKSVTVNGNIGTNATVSVVDGTLRIQGSIAEGACIKVTASPKNVPIPSSISISNNGHISLENTMINGVLVSMDESSCTSCDWQSVSIEIDGDVGSNAIVECSGNITVKGNIGESAHISSMSGDIKVGNVGAKAEIMATNGSIECWGVGAHARIDSPNGKIELYVKDNTAQISSAKGTLHGIMRMIINGTTVTSTAFRSVTSINGVVSDTHPDDDYSGYRPTRKQEYRYSSIEPKESESSSNVGWLLLSGLITAIGITAVAVAFTVLYGTTLAIVAIGGSIATGVGVFGLFANSCHPAEESCHNVVLKVEQR